LTMPFTALRNVDLSGLSLPPWKLDAISGLGYGDNAKMMVAFDKPCWRDLGSTGASYSDSNLPNHQCTWETNPSRANATRAVLTDYSSGQRALQLNAMPLQSAAAAFVSDLDSVFPGANLHATRANGGQYVAHLEHWPSNPLALGSYTCYLPGQLTEIGGNEGKPVGNVFFAGEHADSFFEWQGFMEGAIRSGIQAAADIVRRK
jgi:monoamine oxidase